MSLKENCVLWIIKLNIMRNYRKRGLWLASLMLWLGLGMSFAAEPRYLNIVFVGNSITYGAGLEEPRREAPPVRAAIYLKRSANVQLPRPIGRIYGKSLTGFWPCIQMPVSSCTVRSGIARILTMAPCTCKRDSIASQPIIPSWSH